DGRGFDDGAGYKAGILISRIGGSKSNWNGTDVWYGDEAGGQNEPFDAKAYGIVSIKDTMYMYAGPGS
ncbi:MAG: hypothetical protein GWN56_01060, partial [Nitrosopumilaceae archaeon]|nr:hypothetical protein [Nitrosopumilaceae archaeon]